MTTSKSNRVISTPSAYAQKNYLYVQEVGSLQSLEPHISKRKNLASLLFFVVTKGSGTLIYKGMQHTLHTGDCIFIDCKEEYSHESSNIDPWELSWVHFYGLLADSYYKNYLEQGNFYLFRPLDLSLFLEKLDFLYMCQKNHPPYMELISHKYLTDLIFLSFTKGNDITIDDDITAHNHISDSNLNESIYDKLLQIKQFIDSNFSKKITLDNISEQFFISKFHLSREFKRMIGVTVGSYILGRRISNAKNMLRFTDLSVEEISSSCGFSDTGYFIKVFKKSELLTPMQYRKKW